MAAVSDADRDAEVWAAIGGDLDELGGETPTSPDDSAEPIQLSRSAWNAVLSRLDELDRRVDQLENGDGPPDDGPPIVHYANIPADERQKHLSTSDHIAVTIHEQWGDIAWSLGGARDQVSGDLTERRTGVDTKTKASAKNNPSRLRHRLKQALDRELQATEIYRGLRALAKLSGGEEHVDDAAGRTHITGGLYEYHEKATTDGKGVRRVLWKADND